MVGLRDVTVYVINQVFPDTSREIAVFNLIHAIQPIRREDDDGE